MPLIHAELSEHMIGCGITVHRTLGPGFLEKIDEEAPGHELDKAGVRYERQKTMVVLYDGKPVGEHRVDLLAEGLVVLELKATSAIEGAHPATARSYLKATSHQLALAIIFARPTLDIRRVVLTQ